MPTISSWLPENLLTTLKTVRIVFWTHLFYLGRHHIMTESFRAETRPPSEFSQSSFHCITFTTRLEEQEEVPVDGTRTTSPSRIAPVDPSVWQAASHTASSTQSSPPQARLPRVPHYGSAPDPNVNIEHCLCLSADLQPNSSRLYSVM